jgi:cell division protein FtsB
MVVLTELRRRARQIVGPILGISLVAYFAYHLVQGDRGLIAMLGLMQQVKQAQSELDASEAERLPLANRVALLRPDHLDRDLLDERVRAVLNAADSRDFIVMVPAKR